MDIAAHRRERLRRLIATEFSGSRQAFCDASGLTEARLAQLLSDTYRDGREPGEKAARSIEKKLKLPDFFFDQSIDVELLAQHRAKSAEESGGVDAKEIAELIMRYARASRAQRKIAMNALPAVAVKIGSRKAA